MKISAFITPKKSELMSDCQDRFAIDYSTRTVAVSDGVSQSIFQDLWAQLIVDHYVKNGRFTEEDRVGLCSSWKLKVLDYIETVKKEGGNPWRAEDNLKCGYSAGATLCGVKFLDDSRWECDVIGDSALVLVNEESGIQILSSEDKKFDNEPDFIDSNPEYKGRGIIRKFSGEISANNYILIVSDPFSEFFSKDHERAISFIKKLKNAKNHDDYLKLVDVMRAESNNKSDDSTALIVEWDGSQVLSSCWIDNIEQMIEEEKQELLSADKGMTQSSEDGTTANYSPIYDPTSKGKNKDTVCDNNSIRFCEKELLFLQKQFTTYLECHLKEQIDTSILSRAFIKFIFSKESSRLKELNGLIDSVFSSFIKTLPSSND